MGDSDVGLTMGFGFGASRPPALYSVASAEFSLNGRINTYVEGEVRVGEVRYVGKVSTSLAPREVYPAVAVDPDEIAVATQQRIDIKLSALRPVGEHSEFGPAAWVESTIGIDPETPDGDPLEILSIPRFRPGSLALGGVRWRWRSTSSVRPMDGTIVDAILQAGAAFSEAWDTPRPDATVQLLAARAIPVHERMRVYLRGDTRHQLNAPPPVRNYMGGDKKVRGQPSRRETGRRTITGRAQLHALFIRDWRWPMETAHRLMPFLPVYDLDVELVPFYDVGWVGDPDFGWRRTRHGVGAGLHIVLPPELVIRMDVGISPGGSPRFYFTVGESI